MLKEDTQTTISDQAYAVRLLKRSGLTGPERRQVLASAGAVYDTKKIKASLRQLFRDAAAHQDHDRSVQLRQARFASGGKAKGKGRGKSKGFGKSRPFVAYVEDPKDDDDEMLFEDDDEEDGEQAYAAELAGVDEDDDWNEDEYASAGEEEEALAAFLSAKQRLARVRKQGQCGFSQGP